MSAFRRSQAGGNAPHRIRRISIVIAVGGWLASVSTAAMSVFATDANEAHDALSMEALTLAVGVTATFVYLLIVFTARMHARHGEDLTWTLGLGAQIADAYPAARSDVDTDAASIR